MNITIDTDKKTLKVITEGREIDLPLYSKDAFELISEMWVKVGWNEKYIYTFTWMGRPIIQLPDDMVRIQEVIYSTKPDVIIETGVAHGGSLVFYASLCKAMGKGRIVGIDIEIRAHNRTAIEGHELFPLITLVEGSSVDPTVVARVKHMVKGGEKVMVLLDSNHTKEHVLAELRAYADLVTEGSYIVAMDGIMKDLTEVPRGNATWDRDNPCEAVKEFLSDRSDFVLETPSWAFNESKLTTAPTHWPGAWLRKRSP
jgi:cephalosporin hydroxylase